MDLERIRKLAVWVLDNALNDYDGSRSILLTRNQLIELLMYTMCKYDEEACKETAEQIIDRILNKK